MTTAAPSAASPLAIPAPMPFDAPVTTAVLPDNLLMTLLSSEVHVISIIAQLSNFLQMQGHSLAVAGGEYEPGAFSFGRADGSENIGRTRPLVVRRRRPCPAFRPSVGDLVFLPYPSFRRLFWGRLLHESEKVLWNGPPLRPAR